MIKPACQAVLAGLSVLALLIQTVAVYAVVSPVRDAMQTVHELSTNGDSTGWCSAVAIAPGVAWTAAHCQGGFDQNTTLTVRGKALPVTKFVIPDSKHDFAVIIVPGLTCPCAEIALASQLESFVNVIAVGYPNGGEIALTSGHFIGWMTVNAPELQHEGLLAHTALIFSGNSGGGLFAVIENKTYLIGINIAGLTDGRMFFATDVTRR